MAVGADEHVGVFVEGEAIAAVDAGAEVGVWGGEDFEVVVACHLEEWLAGVGGVADDFGEFDVFVFEDVLEYLLTGYGVAYFAGGGKRCHDQAGLFIH